MRSRDGLIEALTEAAHQATSSCVARMPERRMSDVMRQSHALSQSLIEAPELRPRSAQIAYLEVWVSRFRK